MKKMNKMYEAPKAEVVELNVKNAVMEGGGETQPSMGSGGNDNF
jgi:hypothetical protein